MRNAWMVAILGVAGCVPSSSDDAPARSVPDATPRAWRRVPALDADSRVPTRVLWDRRADRPKMIEGAFAVASRDPEAAAREVLARHAALFRLDGADLAHVQTRTGLAGTYVRFEERALGLPVFGSGVVVALDRTGAEVRAINLAQTGVTVAPPARDLGADAAIAAVRSLLGDPAGSRAPTAVEVVDARRAAVSYRVTIPTDRETWVALVDAATGEVSRLRDDNRYVDGDGFVFDMNALASTNDATLVDNDDATSAALDAARFSVTLPNLDGSGVLAGTYVDARTANLANRANVADLTYQFDRTSTSFSEVMVYYHLDRAQQRIQALGFTDVNNRVQIATVDAIAEDNSFYSPSDKQLSFGTGGVDDAEDAEVIIHEYGHSIHDNQVPGWGGEGDGRAMGEGFGDYLAASFGDVLATAAGHAQLTDPACVADWDAISYGTGTPKCLRRTDTTKHYPEGGTGEVHDDGEIWSAALWTIRAAVGADVMDQVLLESHFLLSPNETFDSAATALLMTDQTLNAGANAVTIRRAMYRGGMARTPMPPSTLTTVVASEDVNITNPTTNDLYPDNLDDTQTYTKAGAQALRLHFAEIETEANEGCVDGFCDNVYLFDGDGDLYQILNGAHTDVDSVVVPGDTVQIRFASDGSVGGRGYVVTRVDELSDAPEPDAGEPAPEDMGDGGGCCDAGGERPFSAFVLFAFVALALTRRSRRAR